MSQIWHKNLNLDVFETGLETEFSAVSTLWVLRWFEYPYILKIDGGKTHKWMFLAFGSNRFNW